MSLMSINYGYEGYTRKRDKTGLIRNRAFCRALETLQCAQKITKGSAKSTNETITTSRWTKDGSFEIR